MRMPKLLQPSPTSLTFRPEVPSRRIFIVISPQNPLLYEADGT